ncbi:hypothetical protein AB0I28_12540 [Phytomonospora sp. NPDC050363]|uniref:hypothetical protein n=1 Tax=Phytomonospora sp. NPDC050363 TaxID=3155642 RepID=UPI0034035454
MQYHTPDLPPAIDIKAIVAFLEAVDIPVKHFRGMSIGFKTVTVEVDVFGDDGQPAYRTDYAHVTHHVEIPIARNDA